MPDLPTISTFDYDLDAVIKQLPATNATDSAVMSISFPQDNVTSPLFANFLFETVECHASDKIRVQLTLRSDAQSGTPAITLSTVQSIFQAMHSPFSYFTTEQMLL